MADFKVIDHKKICEPLALLYITDFQLARSELPTEKLVEQFLISDYCRNTHSVSSFGATETWYTYSIGPFKLENITVSDFRKFNRSSLEEYLAEYSNDPSWRDDKTSFTKILGNCFLTLDNSSNADFYLINMEWFGKDKNKLTDDYYIYSFYIIILEVKNTEGNLTLSEWFYD